MHSRKLISTLLIGLLIWWWVVHFSQSVEGWREDFSQYTTFSSLSEKTYSQEPSEERFMITEEWKIALSALREKQTPTNLFKEEKNSEALCAWYIYDLSRLLRWDLIVNEIWLHHPESRKACDAWEMPYCYWRRGATITYDIGDKHGPELKTDPLQYHTRVTTEEMLKLFAAAFEPWALLWDITFLYSQSWYLHMIWSYGNYNSHITKNIWLSRFEKTVQYPEWTWVGNELLLRNTLWCTPEMWTLMHPLFSRYKITINWNEAVYRSDGEITIKKWWSRKPYTLQSFDTIAYEDRALAHFWEWEKVESLFELSCRGEFVPIAVVELNDKFIEKS